MKSCIQRSNKFRVLPDNSDLLLCGHTGNKRRAAKWSLCPEIIKALSSDQATTHVWKQSNALVRFHFMNERSLPLHPTLSPVLGIEPRTSQMMGKHATN